jgi:prepilin-type N-terminal cleavage/methylation domain-containing protein
MFSSRLNRLRGDEGFSLLESVVALSIAGVIFTAFGASLLSAMRSVVIARTVQQSSNIADQSLESMRSLGYDANAMRPTDLTTNEPLNIAGCSCFDPKANTATGAGTEPLALDAAGSIYPHVTTTTTNATVYTIRRYVTLPTDNTGVATKRLTVVVTWQTAGAARKQIVSSTITPTRSGLPLPDFKFTPKTATADCVSPGGVKVFGFAIANNGARDSWIATSTGGTESWEYFADDGAASPGVFGIDDTELPDASGGSLVGPIEPTTTQTFWARADVGASAFTGTSTITFTVTSVADNTFSQTVATTLQIATTCTSLPSPSPTASPSPSPTPTAIAPPQPTTCTGTVPTASPSGSSTATSYYLTNGSTNTDNTPASAQLPLLRLTAPISTTLWNYSTDLATNTAGRYLANTGTTTATTAEWRYQFAGTTKLTGTGVVGLWGAPANGSSLTSLTFNVKVRTLSSTGTVLSTIANTNVGAGSWGCSGFKPFGVSLPFGSGSGTTIAANSFISVTVTVAGSPALLAYDTTVFSPQVVLPVKSGG